MQRTTKITRTAGGCHTCKRRRKRCDQEKPHCRACLRLGLDCEGYEQKLIWGNGIASRGKFKGALIPDSSSQTATAAVRPRARSDAQVASVTQSVYTQSSTSPAAASLSSESPASVSHYEDAAAIPLMANMLVRDDEIWYTDVDMQDAQNLLRDFFAFGHHSLYSTSKQDSPVLHSIRPLCYNHMTLCAVCVAYQALISEGPPQRFQSFYHLALQRFRKDIADPTRNQEDGTIGSGILLCSIGASQGSPWTFHIYPLLDIVVKRLEDGITPFLQHALDIMGYYDLPSFIINRRHPTIGVWQKYCMNPNVNYDSIEPVSGLPRSLLNIISSLEDPDCEEKLWTWCGHEGEFAQIFLWDAIRHAAIFKHRELQEDYDMTIEAYPSSGDIPRRPRVPGQISSGRPSDVVLMNRLVASLYALFRGLARMGEDALVWNAITYPLFIAGCQVHVLKARPEWAQLLLEFLQELLSSGRKQAEPLQNIWSELRRGSSRLPDQMAAEMGLEIALM